MIGTCTKCHQLCDFGSEEAAYEPDRLCPTCYKTQQTEANTRIYKCTGCRCGRVLTIERTGDDYLLHMTDPECDVWQRRTQIGMEAEIAAAVDDENQFIVSEPYSQMSIMLNDAQLRDLCQWAGIEPLAAMDRARE